MQQHSYQIGLEQISSINNFSYNIDPKQLICSVCFCININVKQCKNKQCSKLFCGKCFDELQSKKDRNNNNTLCPYCRTPLNYLYAEENLISTIASLKYFCSEHPTCNSQYSYEELLNNHSSSSLLTTNHNCFVCKGKDLNWKQITKCVMCHKYYCDNINMKCVEKCFNCSNAVCKLCRKGKEGSYLCGMCTVNCVNCVNKEAEVVCNLCNKILCLDCASELCRECNRYYCKDLACHYNKQNNCEYCLSVKQYQMYIKCIHQQIVECRKCYLKCKVCSNIVISNNSDNNGNAGSIIECNECKLKLCACTCSLKCKSCLQFTCYSCSYKCLICKRTSCSKCIRYCSECGVNNSSWLSCKKCNSDALRPCSYTNCNKTLCLNCWNVCNTCNNIYCKSHSIKCDNCEETICNEHHYSCSKCHISSTRNDVTVYRMCLKKCTYKCNFCNNISTATCKKDLHTEVQFQHCEHFVCKECQRTCIKCKKTVISCPKCIVNYYFSLCRYCNNYLCQTCSSKCTKCEDSYCSLMHRCKNCNKLAENTFFCIKCFDSYKMKCVICDDDIKKPCQICASVFLCSLSCYYQFKKKGNCHNGNNSNERCNSVNGVCEMFLCNKHFDNDKGLLDKLNKIDKVIKKEMKSDVKQIKIELDGKRDSCSKIFKCGKCVII